MGFFPAFSHIFNRYWLLHGPPLVLGTRTTNQATETSTGRIIIISVNQNFKGPTFCQIQTMTLSKRLMRLHRSHMTATAKSRLTPHSHRAGTKINFLRSAPFEQVEVGFYFCLLWMKKELEKTMYHFSLPEQWNQIKKKEERLSISFKIYFSSICKNNCHGTQTSSPSLCGIL